MSGRIAKRMHGPAQVSGVAAVKYTVPANRRATVRHIHLQNPSGSPVTFTLSIGSDAAGVRLYDAYSIPANTPFDHFPYYVLEAAEVLEAWAGTAATLVLTINGDEEVLA